MATASASSDVGVPQAVASINITGGTTTVNGNIVRGNVSNNSTATATVTLNGGTLNMTGKSVGSATNTVSLDAQQGTLQNLGELNGGGTLTKTTPGKLVVEGTNTYTGATAVNEGIFQVGTAGAGSMGAGNVTVASGATLAGSGTIGGSTILNTGAVSAARRRDHRGNRRQHHHRQPHADLHRRQHRAHGADGRADPPRRVQPHPGRSRQHHRLQQRPVPVRRRQLQHRRRPLCCQARRLGRLERQPHHRHPTTT